MKFNCSTVLYHCIACEEKKIHEKQSTYLPAHFLFVSVNLLNCASNYKFLKRSRRTFPFISLHNHSAHFSTLPLRAR